MIALFNRRGRILFFPKKWANAVVRWIAGVHSPTGTIKVKNTMSPGDNGSLELDVNMDAVAAETARRMDTRPMTQDERSRFEVHLRGRVDGNSITMKGAHIGVSDEWVENKCREYAQENGLPETTTTTNMPSGEQGDSHIDANDSTTWAASSAAGANGLKIYLPCKSESEGVSGVIHWREFTIGADGRIRAVGAESGTPTMYYANPPA